MQAFEWVYGKHAVSAAVLSQRAQRLFYQAGKPAARDALEKAREVGCEASAWHADKFAARFGSEAVHQGVACQCRPLPLYGEAFLDSLLRMEPNVFLVVLERVNDPQNFGACLRVAAGAGAHAVLFASSGTAGLTPVVAKAASGAIESLPLILVKRYHETLNFLRANAVQLVATSERAQHPIWDVDMRGPSALCVGNEGMGVSAETLAKADVQARVPLTSHVDSLNVSTALAVCAFDVARQRTLAPRNRSCNEK